LYKLKVMKFYKNKLFYACIMNGEFWVRFDFLLVFIMGFEL